MHFIDTFFFVSAVVVVVVVLYLRKFSRLRKIIEHRNGSGVLFCLDIRPKCIVFGIKKGNRRIELLIGIGRKGKLESFFLVIDSI